MFGLSPFFSCFLCLFLFFFTSGFFLPLGLCNPSYFLQVMLPVVLPFLLFRVPLPPVIFLYPPLCLVPSFISFCGNLCFLHFSYYLFICRSFPSLFFRVSSFLLFLSTFPYLVSFSVPRGSTFPSLVQSYHHCPNMVLLAPSLSF